MGSHRKLGVKSDHRMAMSSEELQRELSLWGKEETCIQGVGH